jgi:hypothetical protein
VSSELFYALHYFKICLELLPLDEGEEKGEENGSTGKRPLV